MPPSLSNLVKAREASKVGVPTIARHTLLKLVGRQVVYEMSEDGSAEVHTTFSAKAAHAWQPGFGFKSA